MWKHVALNRQLSIYRQQSGIKMVTNFKKANMICISFLFCLTAAGHGAAVNSSGKTFLQGVKKQTYRGVSPMLLLCACGHECRLKTCCHTEFAQKKSNKNKKNR